MVDKQQLAAMGEHMREMEECKPEFKVPDGWKLVPEAITERMWDAMNESHCSPASWYLAAIENAPEYKT